MTSIKQSHMKRLFSMILFSLLLSSGALISEESLFFKENPNLFQKGRFVPIPKESDYPVLSLSWKPGESPSLVVERDAPGDQEKESKLFLAPEVPLHIDNVGVIKAIEIEVNTALKKPALLLLFRDGTGQSVIMQTDIPGDAHFRPPSEEGRETLVWENPFYIEEVRRREISFTAGNSPPSSEDFLGIILEWQDAPERIEIFEIKMIYDSDRLE